MENETELKKIASKQDAPITPEERHSLIAEKAYQLAKQRNFQGDCALFDWLQAEAIIEHMYGENK